MKHQEEPEKLDPNFPKWLFHESGKKKLVANERELKFLGSAWKDSPAAFGIVTHPHSDEYLARQAADAHVDEEIIEELDHDLEEEIAHKPKGRKPKHKE